MRVAIEEFSRSVLQVTVGHARAPEVPPIEVFCTHLKSKLASMTGKQSYEAHTALSRLFLDFIAYVGDTSNLTLDPDIGFEFFVLE